MKKQAEDLKKQAEDLENERLARITLSNQVERLARITLSDQVDVLKRDPEAHKRVGERYIFFDVITYSKSLEKRSIGRGVSKSCLRDVRKRFLQTSVILMPSLPAA